MRTHLRFFFASPICGFLVASLFGCSTGDATATSGTEQKGDGFEYHGSIVLDVDIREVSGYVSGHPVIGWSDLMAIEYALAFDDPGADAVQIPVDYPGTITIRRSGDAFVFSFAELEPGWGIRPEVAHVPGAGFVWGSYAAAEYYEDGRARLGVEFE